MWPRFIGLISRNAKHVESSQSMCPGISPECILVKIVDMDPSFPSIATLVKRGYVQIWISVFEDG